MKLPSNYLPVMPYLIVKGAHKFIDFAKQVLGAELQYLADRSEGVVMHGELKIGDAVIMFADATEQYQERPAGMFLFVEDADVVYHKAVAANISIINELANRDYGRGFGMEDAFGNQWWVNTPA